MAELCQGAQPTLTVNPPPNPGGGWSSPRTRPSRKVGGESGSPSPGARCHPRPQKRNRGRPAPDTPRSRPGSPPPVSDRSSEARTAAVGGGAGPHPDRRSPHYGAAAPGRMCTSHRPGTLGTRSPGAPMPTSGRAPPPLRAPRVLSGTAGPSKPNPGSPAGPTPVPRVLPGGPPRGGRGGGGTAGGGGLTCATAESQSRAEAGCRRGRIAVALGSRSPWVSRVGASSATPTRGPERGDEQPGRPEASGRGRRWAPTRARRSRVAARVLPGRPLSGRSATAG